MLDAIAERIVDRVLFVAALSASPGCPAVPTATAFHPDDGSASLRATSSLASAAIEVLLAAPEETGDLQGGRHRHDKGIVDRDDHAGDADNGAAGFQRSARRFLGGFRLELKKILPARADRDRLGLFARHITALKPGLSGFAYQRHVLRRERLLDRGIVPDPGLRRHRRPAMRIDHLLPTA